MMKIKVTSIFVDDQERVLRFYTDILGLRQRMTGRARVRSRTAARFPTQVNRRRFL